jgi:hypothetical protein
MNQADFTVGIGTPGGRQAMYSIEVNGELAEADDSLEGNDSISGGWQASGEVWGGWDEYQVRGWVTSIEAPDGVQVEIDGEAMSHDEALAYRPDRFGGGGGDGGGDGGDGDGDESGTDDAPPDRGGSSAKRAPWKARVGEGSDPANGVLGRDGRSSGDRTLHVGHGEFGTGTGTEAEPLGTVQDALNCDPRSVEHDCAIAVAAGTHDNEPGSALNSGQIGVHQTADWRLRGDRENPDEHVINVEQANFQIDPGTAQNARIEGMTIDGTVQIYDGSFGIRDAVIRGGERWGKSDGVALDAYRGHYQIEDTKLVSKSEAINAVEHLEVSFGKGVEIDVDGPLLGTGMGGGTVSIHKDTAVSCNGYLTDPNWDAAMVEVRDPHGALEGLDPGGFADVRR